MKRRGLEALKLSWHRVRVSLPTQYLTAMQRHPISLGTRFLLGGLLFHLSFFLVGQQGGLPLQGLGDAIWTVRCIEALQSGNSGGSRAGLLTTAAGPSSLTHVVAPKGKSLHDSEYSVGLP
jgi:hypothetical protein